jgi:hypothetical protein
MADQAAYTAGLNKSTPSEAERAEMKRIRDEAAMDRNTDLGYERATRATPPAGMTPVGPPRSQPIRRAKGGMISASKRADVIATKGKTKGRIV